MINLPTKDRMGNNFLSYSQIASFQYDKGQYYDSYILKKPFKGNIYTDFGEAVENDVHVIGVSSLAAGHKPLLTAKASLDGRC